MYIKKYKPGEEKRLWEIFFNTIHNINIRDYSQSQILAWAPPDLDTEIWKNKIESINPFVVVNGEDIIAYADLQESGLIDHFYCDYRWHRKGVGSLLMRKIQDEANQKGIASLFSEVSITAKAFYASHGFIVTKNQVVEIRNARFINYRMEKQLTSS